MNVTELEFAKIVKENKATIYSVCYMFSDDSNDVNDLFQEVLINLWRGYEKFRGESKINTWIYRVSLNTCISLDRKKKRRAKREQLAIRTNFFVDDDNDTKQIRQLYNRIHKLGPIDRAIILLWLDNISYEEIAQIIGITVSNVSVKLLRIKEQLKKMK